MHNNRKDYVVDVTLIHLCLFICTSCVNSCNVLCIDVDLTHIYVQHVMYFVIRVTFQDFDSFLAFLLTPSNTDHA